MFWLSVRQFRGQAVVVAAALVALAVVVVIAGLQVLNDFHANVTTCARTGNCGGAAFEFTNRYSTMGHWLNALILVVPGLLGVFWGAPLLAHELETGTFRLAWTQSVSRARWTVYKLGLLGLASIAVAGACSLLVTWWASPLDLVSGPGPFANFDVRGIVPVGYAAFAFSLGVAAGAVIRRTVPAMGATLVAFVGLRLAFIEWVRPHLMAPLVSRHPFTMSTPGQIHVGSPIPQGSWVISQSLVNSAGHQLGGAAGMGLFDLSSTAVGPAGLSLRGVGTCSNIHPTASQQADPRSLSSLVARCVNQLHLTSVTTYQPSSRYWPFQTIETVVFLGLAVAVGAFTVWWVRRLN